MKGDSKRKNYSDDEDLSGSESDSGRQEKGKRSRDDKHSKPDKRQAKGSSDDDGSDREEAKGEHSELFVRNLSWESNEKSLKSFFSKYGTVTNVKILKRDDGKSKGIGFVGFATRKEAQKAVDDGSNLQCDGRDLQVWFSNEKKEEGGRGGDSRGGDRNDSRGGDRGGDRGGSRGGDQEKGNTIYVGNLSYNSSESDLKDFFGDCGNIKQVRLAKDPGGKFKGFGHVEFEDDDGAGNALKKNGDDLDGRPIKVDMSRPSRGGGGGGSFGGRGGRGGGRGDFRGGRGFRGGDRGGRGRGGYGRGRSFNDDDD